MMNLIATAKEAHRNACPMVDCVNCLFGCCNPNCSYQKNFEKELNKLISQYEQRNDNKHPLQGL